ncbi:MAG: N-acetylmuramoyl-L-alanine amidase family protein [Desulfurispora sp.]|uniref:N-acetylmuramoyl-L-alanine amidase family protein n=1 Tax=Desulfurispora sp. TaxID=3014275 RepID=UPI00404B997D
MSNILVILSILLCGLTFPLTTPAGANPPPALKNKVIILDPGHGGFDPGAVSGDIREKDLNLALSRKIADRLKKEGATVYLTRDRDYNLAPVGLHGRAAHQADLSQRAALAREKSADIFVSIHMNSISLRYCRGAEVYHHYQSREGARLASCIQSELIQIPGMRQRTVKPGDYALLRLTAVPAVIVEAGFMTNPEELKQLTADRYQQALAESIVRGIKNYFHPG